MVAALAMAPALVNAQWSAVRYDQHNTFTKVFAATANDVFVIGVDQASYDNFFMRSSDGGTNWDSIGLSAGSDDFQMTEMYFTDVNNGFIGGRRNNVFQNLQKTTDNGTTWTDITPDPAEVEPIAALYFLTPQQGWATCQQELYTTVNGGATWTTIPLSFIPQDIHFMDALVGYATGGLPASSPAVVMKTTDGGLTWTQVLSSSDPNVFVNTNEFLNVVDANILFTNLQWTNKLFRTTDAGATWDTIVCDSVFQIVDFHFNSADSGHILSSMGQLFQTNDGGVTWTLQYSAEWGFYGPLVYFQSLMFRDGVGYVCGSRGLVKRFDAEVTGVDELRGEGGSLKVYPNPCYGAQNITLVSKGMIGDCQLVILNNLGQVVHSEKIESIETKPLVRVRAYILPVGVYTVVLKGDNQKQSSQLVITE